MMCCFLNVHKNHSARLFDCWNVEPTYCFLCCQCTCYSNRVLFLHHIPDQKLQQKWHCFFLTSNGKEHYWQNKQGNEAMFLLNGHANLDKQLRMDDLIA